MIKRLLKLPKKQSFFLFGARGTGKSTLLEEYFPPNENLWLDLLNPQLEDQFLRNPQELESIVLAMPESHQHVVIDEIQKVPKLLDVVQSLMRKTNKNFILTGSSARKLKYGGANLLAGRAFVYFLHPFSYLELGDRFNLNDALNWGMLPHAVLFKENQEKSQFLQAYTYTYLKEEIWGEHFIRKLNPFRRFLEVSAQCNGKIINYSNIAKDVGVDDKTVKDYFSLLEDTLIGFYLEPFQNSFRKRLSGKPKFYFFDVGVVRALTRSLTLPLQNSTSFYGEIFEHFIILECMKLASYFKPEYRFSYLKTKDDAEIDLVVERPGKPLLCIEIKSSNTVRQEDLKSVIAITSDIKKSETVCFSNDSQRKRYEHVTVIPWQQGIKEFFGSMD